MASLDTEQLDTAVVNMVRSMEGATGDPYSASFATAANSGLSYGLLQNDVAANPSARTTFQTILFDAGLSGPEVQRPVGMASTPGITRLAFSTNDLGIIDSALQSQSALVDQQDNATSQLLLNSINLLLSNAALNPNGPGVLSTSAPDATALAMAGAWSNRTNGLLQMAAYFQNYSGQITNQAIQQYISAQKYFLPQLQGDDGASFVNWMTRINAAVASDALTYAPLSSTQENDILMTGGNLYMLQINSDGSATFISHASTSGQAWEFRMINSAGTTLADSTLSSGVGSP